ncbi:unnamed protein product, partial [Didymodactylos carnosus]
MKKGGHRVAIPPSSQINSITVYNVEVIRNTEKTKMLERIGKMGGTSVLPGMSAFVSPTKLSHDITENEYDFVETPTISNVHQQQ